MAARKSYAFRISATLIIVALGQVIQLVLPRQPAVIVNDVSQLAAGVFAAVSCAYFAVRADSWQRRWRILAAIGMTGWSIGQCIWSWYQIVEQTEIPSPSWADAGYLTIAPFALAALAVFARNGSTSQDTQLVLDGLLIVASFFLVTWTTALGATVHQAAPNSFALAVAISYPITDLTLVAIVFLIYTTRSIGREYLAQLSVLGIGLVGLSVSDSVFGYLVSRGVESLPLIGDVGFILGPAFIALAAAMQPRGQAFLAAHKASRPNPWVSLLMPYVPLILATAVLSAEVASGHELDGIEIATALMIFLLVLVRQSLTVVAALRRPSGDARASAAVVRRTDELVMAGVEELAAGATAEAEDTVSRRYRRAIRTELNPFITILQLEHNKQIESLRRSGSRITVITFVGGVVLGVLGNVVVAVLVH